MLCMYIYYIILYYIILYYIYYIILYILYYIILYIILYIISVNICVYNSIYNSKYGGEVCKPRNTDIHVEAWLFCQLCCASVLLYITWLIFFQHFYVFMSLCVNNWYNQSMVITDDKKVGNKGLAVGATCEWDNPSNWELAITRIALSVSETISQALLPSCCRFCV